MPRRTRGGLAHWLRDSTTPLAVVDARRVVLFFNTGCEELTGWLAEDVVGRVSDYASEPTSAGVDALLCALCPPPDALAGRPCSLPIEVPHRDGQLLPRTAVYLPLPGPGQRDSHVLCVWLPRESTVSAPAELPATAQWHGQLARLREQLQQQYRLEHIIAHSPAMHRVLAQVRSAIDSRVRMHISGPPGSGREYLARVVHLQSLQRTRPFVPIDCGQIPASELLGVLQRLFAEEASSPELRPGTILLRDVSRLPRDVQRYLVDQLESPAGTALAEHVSVHSLDSVSLWTAVEEERLLPELFYLLTTLTIEVPALDERRDDLPYLAQYFLERQNRASERPLTGFAAETLERLRQYNWPAQVRELRQVVEEAHAAATGPFIQAADLPFRFRTGEAAQRSGPRRQSERIDLEAMLREVETREIRRVLAECRENRAEAARRLGLTRTKLYRRIEQLGLDSPGTTEDSSQ